MLGEMRNLPIEQPRGYDKRNSIVVALPGGGVLIGYYIAKALHLPLDISLIQKIGHQFNKDFPIGYVGLNSRSIKWASNVSIEYADEATKRIQKKLHEDYYNYTGRKEPCSLNGKTVIISDDDVISGETLLRTIRLIKKDNPLRIIAVSPLVNRNSIEKISKQVQRFIYLKSSTDPGNEKEIITWLPTIDENETIRLLRNTTN